LSCAAILLALSMSLSAFIVTLAILLRLLPPRACEERGERGISAATTFTILVPIRNEPEEVVKTFRQVIANLDKRGLEVEVIVIDDSDKEHAQYVDRYLGDICRIIRREKPSGFKPGALNCGLERSRGEVVVIVDSDTIVPGDFLHVISKCLGERAHYVQAPSLPLNAKTPTHYAYYMYELFRNKFLLRGTSFIGYPLISGFGYAFRRKALVNLGGWREDLLAEDAELSVRVACEKASGRLANLMVNDLPPASLRDLRRQQERWILGSFQALREAFREALRGKVRALIYAPLLSFYLGLLSNVLVGLVPIAAAVSGETLTVRNVVLMFVPTNILLGIFTLLLVMPATYSLGVKRTIIGAALSGALYNALSLYAAYALLKTILGARERWRVTGKLAPKAPPANLMYFISTLFYFVSLALSLLYVQVLSLWLFGLALSSAICWVGEVKGTFDVPLLPASKSPRP